MLSPLLIIGVGGAGGKTIRAMKQELNRILESSGHADGIPAAWQFLHIDTTRDGIDFPAPMLPADEFHCVVPAGVDIYEITESIIKRGTASEQQKMLAGWGVAMPRIKINGAVPLGRATGRQCGVASLGGTLQALQNSISKMQSPTAMAELGQVAHLMGAMSPQNQPQAFIVSSLAGTSGSGMFMDVAELLKRATSASWGHESISLLYTPEVFSSIRLAGSDISKNTLGAMNELIASQWVAISERSELLYSKMGLVASNSTGVEGFGCKTNILIGPQNSTGADIRVGANDEGINEVFLSFGKSLAGAISNDDAYGFLIQSHRYRSWSHGAVDISGLAPGNFQGLTGVSSIGFGQMTLGADRIVDYVADALTKRQVEKLLWPELTPGLLKSGIDVMALIQEKADEIWPNFLLDSGLDGRGFQNQIVDALLPEQAQERIKQYVNGLIKKNVTATPQPPATFTRAIWSEWETESGKFLTSLKNEMSSKAQKWVESIQEKLRDQFASELALNGYAVLTNLTERLEVELRDHVMPERLMDQKKFSNAISGFDQQIFNRQVNEIADGLTGVSTQNGPFLDKLSQSLARVVEFQVNSHINALAASLLQDMLSLFIAPLREQLAFARADLQRSQKSELLPNGSRNPNRQYPDWGSGQVPNQYKNRPLERFLIDPAEYESTYDFYASKDSQGAPAFQQSVSSALLGKKMNPIPGVLNPQTLIIVNDSWITGVREAQGSIGAVASKSAWNFNTDIEDLSRKNRAWLRDKESSFGIFTNLSIRDYVTATGVGPEIRGDRESKFVMEFQAMLALAQPLILLNPNAMQYILSKYDGRSAEGTMLKTSKIPFALNSEIGHACTKVLQQNGFNPSDPSFEQNWFNPGSNESTLFATSTIQNTLPIWAFASITEPILNQAEVSKMMRQIWEQFWEGRRNRPLIESIPFETEMRRSIITGWFVATLFGMRKVKSLPAGRTVQIWNPTLKTPDWSSFPSPLLATHFEDSQRESWALPQLLMSAGIALANFGKTGNPEFINGYRLLKYLGREVTTSFNNRDHWDGHGAGDLLPTGEPSQSNYLMRWVESGELPNENGELLKVLQASLALTPDRAEALIKTVQLLSTEYKNIWSEISSRAWHDLPETWELKEDIDQALSDIAEYVSHLRSSTSITSD
jgi:hypothetical protein